MISFPFRRSRKQGRPASSNAFSPELECFGESPSARPAARRIADFQPALETLESRLVPTGVMPTDQNSTTYVLLQNGTLYEHVGTDSSTGWYFIWNNVKQVSRRRRSAREPGGLRAAQRRLALGTSRAEQQHRLELHLERREVHLGHGANRRQRLRPSE